MSASQSGVSPPPDWEKLIAAALSTVSAPVNAVDFVESLHSASEPQKIRCDDGRLYAVKFSSNKFGNGQATFLEQLVPAIGLLIGAPVPEVRRVSVSQEFLDVNDIQVAGNPAPHGVHHGSAWSDNYADRMEIDHVDANREALGALTVLYTWLACAGDQQLIYSNVPPHRVLSVDHSAFLVYGGVWDEATLTALPAPTAYDPWFDRAGLTDVDRSASLDALEAVTADQIAAAVAPPPSSWGVSMPSRVALAKTIYSRQDQVLGLSGRVRT